MSFPVNYIAPVGVEADKEFILSLFTDELIPMQMSDRSGNWQPTYIYADDGAGNTGLSNPLEKTDKGVYSGRFPSGLPESVYTLTLWNGVAAADDLALTILDHPSDGLFEVYASHKDGLQRGKHLYGGVDRITERTTTPPEREDLVSYNSFCAICGTPFDDQWKIYYRNGRKLCRLCLDDGS